VNGTPELRRAAREIFDAALKSVDAGEAVRRAVSLDGPRLKIRETTFDLSKRDAGVYVLAVGKAALSMASALEEVLGQRIKAGIIVGPKAHRSHASTMATPLKAFSSGSRWRVFEGGHPLPNRASLLAAQAAFELLERAEAERALVVFLISGGGSAMIEWPRDDRITLQELRAANRLLVSCGAAIAEINAVRRAFSAVKGGALAARAPHTNQLSLIVSDTLDGEEANVASGPTLDPPIAGTLAADQIVERYGLASRLPLSVMRAINQAPGLKARVSRRARREHYVLLDNRRAIEAAARAAHERGFAVELAGDIIDQPIAAGCTQMLTRLLALWAHSSQGERKIVCLVSGGEFACPVKGRGSGGRNSETALRCAIEMDERYAEGSDAASLPSQLVALSAGTDGVDGNSPAAGALAERTTLERARLLQLDARRFLDASDAYSFFNALGDALLTGPTGTNVRDLRILLAG
jgi:hydroxypyruvate reductase